MKVYQGSEKARDCLKRKRKKQAKRTRNATRELAVNTFVGMYQWIIGGLSSSCEMIIL